MTITQLEAFLTAIILAGLMSGAPTIEPGVNEDLVEEARDYAKAIMRGLK